MKKKYLTALTAALILVVLIGFALHKAPAETIAIGLEDSASAQSAPPEEPQTAQNEPEETAEANGIHQAIRKTLAVSIDIPKGPFRATAYNSKTAVPTWIKPTRGRSTLERMTDHANEILHDIICHPDKIAEYGNVLTPQSSYVFDHIQYFYKNREYAWPMGWTTYAAEEDGYIKCEVRFAQEWRKTFDKNELVIDEAVYKLCPTADKYPIRTIRISYIYEKKSGLISVYKIDQESNAAGIGSKEYKKYSCTRCVEE